LKLSQTTSKTKQIFALFDNEAFGQHTLTWQTAPEHTTKLVEKFTIQLFKRQTGVKA
jgi:hypothetical protein